MGGPGSEGELLEILNQATKRGKRNLAKVRWPSGKSNIYRLAYEGHVDIMCTDEEAGGFYYRDHLPCLDTADFTSLRTSETPTEKTNVEVSSSPYPKDDVPQQATPPADKVPQQATPPADKVPQQATPPADKVPQQATPPADKVPMDTYLHAAQACNDSEPEDGRADGADVEEDPRKITTVSAAPSPAGELPPSPTTALSSSSPGTGDCLQTTPASTPEATQDSGFEEHGGAGDSRSTATTEGSDEADSVSDTAASLDEQTSPQDITVWPSSGPAAGRETDRQATASDTATAEEDSSTESQDSPAFLDPRTANEVSGGGACLHDSSAVALTTVVTTETVEKQPTGSSDSAVAQDSTLRPETQVSSIRSPMGTATGQDGDDRTTNRLTGLDEAATGTGLQTETQKAEATTPEEDGHEHKTSQSAVAGQAGDGQHRDAGDGQVRDAGDSQLRDVGDDHHLDSGDGQLPDAGDGQLPDTGDGQLSDAGDGQHAGDGQLSDAGDGQHAGDGQLSDAGDGQHAGDGQLSDAGDGQHAGDGQLSDAGDGQHAGDGQLSDAGDGQLPDAGDGQLPDAGDGLPPDPTGATSSVVSQEREADAASERPPDPTGPATVEVELGASAAPPPPEQRDAVPTDGAHGPENIQETRSSEGEIISNVAEADWKPEDGFRVGDRAAIGVPPDTLVELQQNFGGVTHSMLKKIGQVGVVTRVRPPGTVGLRLGKVVFRMNPVALLKVHQHSTGDKVLIRDDLYQLRVLNDRLGWNSGMDRTAGKVGEVTKVDSDGDLTVSFGHRSYIYSPSCCLPAPPGSSVEELSHRGARAMGSNGTESLHGLSSMSERLAGLLSGATGGRGHRIRLSDLAQMGSLGDLAELSSLGEQLGEHLSQLRQLTGMGGLGLVTGDESTEEGRLHMAIITGDVDKVKEMCRANTALLSSVHNGLTPLMLASHQGKRKVALALLDLGADVNGMGVKQQTALGAALEEKKEEMAMLLLEKGADPRHKNGKERTPLHMAVFNRLNEVAQIIIHMGADINAQDKYGDTPLHDAIARQNTVMVDLLLQLDNINVRLVNRKGYTPLQLACRVQNTEVVGLLLALDNTNVNQLKEQDFAALHICVTHKYLDGVRLLITNGNADVNLPSGHLGFTALHVACLHAYVDIVECLLELGAKVNVHDHNGETPLHVAMGGYDGKEQSSEERERAVQARIRAACLLITNGAFVDAENKKGRPPTTYGPSEVRIGVAQFIDKNPHLVRRKGQSGGATSDGAKQSLIMTSLRKVSLPCRQCQKESDVTLTPCGHRVVCATCALTVNFCPLCGAEVTRGQGEKDLTLAAKRPATAEDSQASDPHLSQPGSLSLPGSTSDPDVSRPGSRLDSTVDTQAPAKRNGQSVEATPAAESISEVTVTAGRSPDAVDQVQGLTSGAQKEKPSADPSEDQPVTSSTDLSPKQPGTVSTDLSPNLPENPSEELSQEQAENPSAELSQEQAENPSAELSQEPAEDPSAELSQEPAENPSAELSQEPAENPSAELSQEQAENPSAELSQEQAEIPSAELSQEQAEIPSAELSQEQAENPSAELSQEQAENPSAELSQEQAENPSAELSQEPAEDPSAELSQEPAENPSAELSQEQAEIPSAELSQEQAEIPSAELSQEQAEIPSAELSQEQAENPSQEQAENAPTGLSLEQPSPAEAPPDLDLQQGSDQYSSDTAKATERLSSDSQPAAASDTRPPEAEADTAPTPASPSSHSATAEEKGVPLTDWQPDQSEQSPEKTEVLTDVGLLSSFAPEPTAQVDTPQPGESPASVSLQPKEPLLTTPTLSRLHQDAHSEDSTHEESALKIAVSPQVPAEESESHAAGKESHHGGDSPNRTVSGQAPPPGNTTAGEPAHLRWSITAGEQAHPSVNATASQQATPLSADGQDTPPRNVTSSEQAPPPLNVTASGQAQPPLNASASGQAPPPLSVTASGQAPPPHNVTASGQATPPLSVTASGQAPPPLNVTASGKTPPPLNVTASRQAPPPLNVTASGQARPPWNITVGAQARPPHRVTASGQARPPHKVIASGQVRPPWNTESVADRGGLPWNTESIADRGGLPWADSPKSVRDELGDSLKPDGVNHTTSGRKPKVFDRDDDDFVLPDIPSVPAGGGWVVIGPGGPFDLTGSSAFTGGAASHEKPRVDPWSFSDQQASGSVLAAIGEGRGNVSQVRVGAEARGRAPQASAGTKGRGNTSRANVWEEGTGSASRVSVWEKGRGNMSEFSTRGGWEETASSQICLGAEGGETGTASRAGSREDRRWDMAQLSMREDRRRDVPELSMREDRRRDVPQLSMREDRRRDVPQLSMREGGRWDAPQVSARQQRGSNTPVVKTKAEERKDTSALSAVERDPKELSDLNSQGLQVGLHFEKKSVTKEEKKEVARPPSPSHKASPDDSSSPEADARRQDQSPVPKEGAASTVSSDSAPNTSSASDKCGEGNKPKTPLTPDGAAPVARTQASEPTGGGLNTVEHNVKTYFQADNLAAILGSVARSDGAGARGKANPAAGVYQPANRSLNAEALLATPSSAADSRTREVAQQPKTATGNRQPEGDREASRGASERERLQPNSEIAKGSDVQKPRSAGSPRETEPRHTNATATDISKSHLADDDTSKTQSGIQKSDGPNPQTGISSFGARPPKGETTAKDAVQSADDSDEVSEGDRVVIRVSEERLVELQRGYGGTTKGMLQCVGRTGTVTGRTARGAVCVKFSSLAYRFNPRALLKVHVHNSGDTVRVLRDLDLVKLLNKRVGYCPAMAETLGKVGTITKIDDDYDVTVKFGQSSFRYSPACCVPAPGATPDTVTATPGGEGEVVNRSRDEASSDRQAFMKRLAQMVKEGTTVSKVMGSSRGDSSAISRLFTAIKDGNSQLVKEMCQNDPSLVNKMHEGRILTPLMYASWKGQIGIVRELLDMGADVNGFATGSGILDSRSPLSAALESGEEETAVLLLERGADPRRPSAIRHRTPLHMAALGNHVQVLQILLQMDVDVNAKDVLGDTPLLDALINGNRTAADILLALDHVDVTMMNHKGITPLHAACLRNIPSAVENILTRDTSHVNSLMDGEYAPLHLAANDDCVENIRLLLNSGADVNVVAGGDHEGNRPIHHACLNGHLPSVEVLLDFGAEVNVANKTGDTPLHFAMGGRIPKEVAGQASEIIFQEERVRIACTLIANGAFVDAEDSKGRTCMRYGGPEIQAAVQDFMDRNRHLVRKKGKGGSGGEARPTLVLRGVPLPCALCKSSMSDVTLLPCGHKTACSKCAGALAVCPLCQFRVDSTTTDDQKGALFEAISHAW